MIVSKKIKITLGLLISTALAFAVLAQPAKTYAETIECADGSVRQVSESDSANPGALCGEAGIKPGATVQPGNSKLPKKPITSLDQPKSLKTDCPSNNSLELSKDNCGIIKYLVLFIQFLTAIVAIVVVISIIIGGIQYSTSADDPGMVTAAKKRIINALLALALYIFTFAILQFLIPGGVL